MGVGLIQGLSYNFTLRLRVLSRAPAGVMAVVPVLLSAVKACFISYEGCWQTSHSLLLGTVSLKKTAWPWVILSVSTATHYPAVAPSVVWRFGFYVRPILKGCLSLSASTRFHGGLMTFCSPSFYHLFLPHRQWWWECPWRWDTWSGAGHWKKRLCSSLLGVIQWTGGEASRTCLSDNISDDSCICWRLKGREQDLRFS